ncbi:general secretion pathway protein K [Tamilnaduibacter salinus]|uniref:Type II secretion system protein K n=1 Tax=Tamilnaduibacter salinus TaxID=1484056 RepID=A0A2U1CZ92_9GAMM|nr:type II secretion system minor pseudopilin GspK [Tamilnaduibacter salinus]PVY78108.1 general secretion pathway protein K [Tamilnaduibacter salinus]
MAAPNQRGVALIMVLLAMALVVTLVGGMTHHQALRVYKATHQMARIQGQGIAYGAEAFAKQILRQDYDEDQEENLFVDSAEEVWAQYSAVVPVEQGRGVVEVQINDLGGRLNLNNLVAATGEVNEQARQRLDRLLTLLEIQSVRPAGVIDWIDSNRQTVNAYGAEDGDYLVMDPPYRAANQPFADVSELRLIEGMTEKAYQALAPYVTALPVSGTGINVNMAAPLLIQSLHPNLTASQAESVVQQRADSPFENIEEFMALPEFAGLGLKADGLAVRTRFFDVASRVTYNDNTYRLVTRMYRAQDGSFSVLGRDEGQRNLITKERFSVSGEG